MDEGDETTAEVEQDLTPQGEGAAIDLGQAEDGGLLLEGMASEFNRWLAEARQRREDVVGSAKAEARSLLEQARDQVRAILDEVEEQRRQAQAHSDTVREQAETGAARTLADAHHTLVEAQAARDSFERKETSVRLSVARLVERAEQLGHEAVELAGEARVALSELSGVLMADAGEGGGFPGGDPADGTADAGWADEAAATAGAGDEGTETADTSETPETPEAAAFNEVGDAGVDTGAETTDTDADPAAGDQDAEAPAAEATAAETTDASSADATSADADAEAADGAAAGDQDAQATDIASSPEFGDQDETGEGSDSPALANGHSSALGSEADQGDSETRRPFWRGARRTE
jgi:vacuolar-type H+-ATPase subunit H